jgi:hypothetical protein
VGGAFGGLEWRTREGMSFFAAAKAIGFSDQSTVVSARGGVRVAFLESRGRFRLWPILLQKSVATVYEQ